MDYKADGAATCDGCGQLTNNRCSSSGMIVCDECRAGTAPVIPNPVPRYIHDEVLKELADAKAEVARLIDDKKHTLSHIGTFVSDIIYAAFGHRDALTDEQIVESLRQLRKEKERLV